MNNFLSPAGGTGWPSQRQQQQPQYPFGQQQQQQGYRNPFEDSLTSDSSDDDSSSVSSDSSSSSDTSDDSSTSTSSFSSDSSRRRKRRHRKKKRRREKKRLFDEWNRTYGYGMQQQQYDVGAGGGDYQNPYNQPLYNNDDENAGGYYQDEEGYGNEEYGEEDDYYDPYPDVQVVVPTHENYRSFVDMLGFAVQSFCINSIEQEASIVLEQLRLKNAKDGNASRYGGSTNGSSNGAAAASKLEQMRLTAFSTAVHKFAMLIMNLPPALHEGFNREIAQRIGESNATRLFMDALRYEAAITWPHSPEYLQIPADVACGNDYYVYVRNPNQVDPAYQQLPGAGGVGFAGGIAGGMRNNNPVIRLEEFALSVLRTFIVDFNVIRQDHLYNNGIEYNNQQYHDNTAAYASSSGQHLQQQHAHAAAAVGVDAFRDVNHLKKSLEVSIEKELHTYAGTYTRTMPVEEMDPRDAFRVPIATTKFLGSETQKQFGDRQVQDAIENLHRTHQQELDAIRGDIYYRDSKLLKVLKKATKTNRKNVVHALRKHGRKLMDRGGVGPLPRYDDDRRYYYDDVYYDDRRRPQTRRPSGNRRRGDDYSSYYDDGYRRGGGGKRGGGGGRRGGSDGREKGYDKRIEAVIMTPHGDVLPVLRGRGSSSRNNGRNNGRHRRASSSNNKGGGGHHRRYDLSDYDRTIR